MEILLIALFFGVFSALIASNRGQSTFRWFLIGFLLGPFGLLFAFFMERVEEPKVLDETIKVLKNDTYFYHIPISKYNWTELKDKINNEYFALGFNDIKINKENSLLVKNSDGTAYYQLTREDTMFTLELFKAPRTNLFDEAENKEEKLELSVADEINKLKSLLGERILTKEEFEQQKNKLLEKN